MVSSKLSDTDKLEITKLYCRPGETTSTLASKYGVSSSTVSRVLKQVLSEDDYGRLMQWKRSGEPGALDLEFHLPPAETAPLASLEPEEQETVAAAATPEPMATATPEESAPLETSGKRLLRRRTTAEPVAEPDSHQQLPLTLSASEEQASDSPNASLELVVDVERDLSELGDEPHPLMDVVANEPIGTARESEQEALAAWVSEGLGSPEDYEDEDDDDDFDDEEDEDDDEDWDESSPGNLVLSSHKEQIEIRPFEDLMLQKPCYLVVDRLSELITCPLRDFAELGLIPADEEQARTLPVFDNHRIARRFARRNQKIIKIPNGIMLTKTQPHLQAKGISRVLFDGQVYSIT